MPRQPRAVLQSTTEELRQRGARVKQLAEQLGEATRARDQLVVDALNEGMSQRDVANAIGVARGRIHAILTASDPDEDE